MMDIWKKKWKGGLGKRIQEELDKESNNMWEEIKDSIWKTEDGYQKIREYFEPQKVTWLEYFKTNWRREWDNEDNKEKTTNNRTEKLGYPLVLGKILTSKGQYHFTQNDNLLLLNLAKKCGGTTLEETLEVIPTRVVNDLKDKFRMALPNLSKLGSMTIKDWANTKGIKIDQTNIKEDKSKINALTNYLKNEEESVIQLIYSLAKL